MALTSLGEDWSALLKQAIGVGIGLFIAFIGLVNARVVIVPPGTIQVLATGAKVALPPVTFGSLRHPETAIALASLLVMAALMARRVKGAILIGIGFGTVVSLVAGVASLPRGSWLSIPRFDTVGWFGFTGSLRKTYSWSPTLRGQRALLQVSVAGPGGTRTVAYAVRVR